MPEFSIMMPVNGRERRVKMKMEYLVSALTSHESKPSEIALGVSGPVSLHHPFCLPLGSVILCAEKQASCAGWLGPSSVCHARYTAQDGMESQILWEQRKWSWAAEGLSIVWALKCI